MLDGSTCVGSGITECCDSDCKSANGDCYCDKLCYMYDNCCEDVEDIGCLGKKMLLLDLCK